jgi:hypothetical protein
MYSPTPPPPLPPPKPSSHEASRLGTPSISQSPRPSPLTDNGFGGAEEKGKGIDTDASGLIPAPSRHNSQRLRQQQQQQPPPEIQDPGETWLPKFLEDKSYVSMPLLPVYQAPQMPVHTFFFILAHLKAVALTLPCKQPASKTWQPSSPIPTSSTP